MHKMMFGGIIEVTSTITYHKINDIVAAKEAILEHIRKEAKKIRRAEDLVETIFSQPFAKVKHLTEAKLYAEGTGLSEPIDGLKNSGKKNHGRPPLLSES